MKIRIEYEAEVPKEIVKSDFCNKHSGAKCDGIAKDNFPCFTICSRFSVRLEEWHNRYRKCDACKKACEAALCNKTDK